MPAEDDNHAARAKANAELGKIGSQVDDLGTHDTQNDELTDEVGANGSEQEKLDRFKDQINDELDVIQTLINHNQIGPADQRLRELVRRVGRVVEGAKGKAALKALQAAEKAFKAAKREITEPAIPMDDVVAMFEHDWGLETPGAPPAELV